MKTIMVLGLLVLAACGGTFEAEEKTTAPAADAGCFPSIVDCRGDGSARTCKQGDVCLLAEGGDSETSVDAGRAESEASADAEADGAPEAACTFNGSLDVAPAEPTGLCSNPGGQGCFYVYPRTGNEVRVYSCPALFLQTACPSYTTADGIQGFICCPAGEKICGPL